MMLKYFLCLSLLFLSVVRLSAQANGAAGGAPSERSFAAEIELAKQAVVAHGGDKLKNLKSLVIKGSVDVTTSAFAQTIPASFVTIFAGEKYRIEIANPIQPFKQTYDGTQTSSTLRGGISLPPINRLGLPLLQQFGKQGFVITSLPEAKKKRKGFRMTSPEGYYTDFYLDDKTHQIKGYDASYDTDGRKVTTSVEVDKYRDVDGVLIPEKYAQRFDMAQITVYANFRAKEITVNTEVPDGVFSSAD
jgi:hypothetical protein